MKRRTLALAVAWLYLTVTLAACSTTAATTTTVTAPTIVATRGVSLSPTLPPTPATPAPAVVGSVTATTLPATATRSSAATATRGMATTSPTLQPRGTIPTGWKIYQSTLGFAIAYPSDWTVDDQAAIGLVYFYAPVPTRTTFLVIATTGKPEPNANLDVLRNTWYKSRTQICADFAIERTAEEQFAGIEFATVGATCDIQQQLAFSYTGIGLRQQVPWIFELNAPYASYDVAFTQSFKPMLDSLNISAVPQR